VLSRADGLVTRLAPALSVERWRRRLRAPAWLLDEQLDDRAARRGLAVDEPRGRHLDDLKAVRVELADEWGRRIREEDTHAALLEPPRRVPQAGLRGIVEASRKPGATTSSILTRPTCRSP